MRQMSSVLDPCSVSSYPTARPSRPESPRGIRSAPAPRRRLRGGKARRRPSPSTSGASPTVAAIDLGRGHTTFCPKFGGPTRVVEVGRRLRVRVFCGASSLPLPSRPGHFSLPGSLHPYGARAGVSSGPSRQAGACISGPRLPHNSPGREPPRTFGDTLTAAEVGPVPPTTRAGCSCDGPYLRGPRARALCWEPRPARTAVHRRTRALVGCVFVASRQFSPCEAPSIVPDGTDPRSGFLVLSLSLQAARVRQLLAVRILGFPTRPFPNADLDVLTLLNSSAEGAQPLRSSAAC